MAKIRKTVVLHEKTVQKAAAKKVSVPKRKKTVRKPKNSPVVVTHWSDGVDQRIINYVTVNRIHHSRIEVVAPGEIIIHN